MTGGKLLVPSDITLLEDKYAKGRRRLTLFERLGLMGIPPMYHWRHTKNDRSDLRRVLSLDFNAQEGGDKEILDVLTRRQKSIRKQVLSQNFLWLGTFLATGLTWMSLRHYDYKSKLIVLPFVAYGGSWLGRWTGDALTGRWREYGVDRHLARLPPRQYFEPHMMK